MRKIIIEVQGGLVQKVYTNVDNGPIEVYVIDWDNINAGQTEEVAEEMTVTLLHIEEFQSKIKAANKEIQKNKEE